MFLFVCRNVLSQYLQNFQTCLFHLFEFELLFLFIYLFFVYAAACARFLYSSPATESFWAMDRVDRTWAARATISNNGCSPMRGREGPAKAWQRLSVFHSVHTRLKTHAHTHTATIFFFVRTQNKAIKFSMLSTHCVMTEGRYSVYTPFFISKNRDAA